MSLENMRMEAADFSGRGISELPRYPALKSPEFQRKFDELTVEVVAPKHNALIDALISDSGAEEIGFSGEGFSAKTVGAGIRELDNRLSEAVIAAGNVPLGGLEGQRLAKASDADRDLEWVTSRLLFNLTLTAAGWTGENAPYTQTVAAEGVTAADTPHVTPVYDAEDIETVLAQKEAWSAVCEAETGSGVIVFRCFEDAPAENIPVQVEVIR